MSTASAPDPEETGEEVSGPIRAPRAWPRRLQSAGGLDLLLVIAAVAPVVLLALDDAYGRWLVVLPLLVVAVAARMAYTGTASALHARPRVHRVVAGTVAGAVTAFALAVVVGLTVSLERVVLPATISALAVAATLLAAGAARGLEVRAGASNRRVYLIGSDAQRRDLTREVARHSDSVLVGATTVERLAVGQVPLEEIRATRPSTLVLSSHAVDVEPCVAAASALHADGVRVRRLADFYEDQFRKVPVSDLSESWFLFDVAEIHRPRLYGVVKRVVETTVALGLLLLSSPILPFLALAVRLSSPGPVLFHQVRVGKDGKLIELMKFRTMTVAPVEQEGWATESLARITRAGRFMRRYRLDELPQLYNVVRGELALVGPRPEQPRLVERLSDQIDFYNARHRVRPGLTGWAQVNYGYGGSTADTIEKLQYEFFYIKYQSLRLDVWVIVSTIRTILAGSGS